MEAAVKARSKLAHYSSTYNEDDVMTISSLYDQMKDIEGISRQLPTIVERLQQLALLHSQAADFSKRLSSVEEDARHNERICKSLESTFASLDKGLASNLSIIEANMEKLDNQMKDLVA